MSVPPTRRPFQERFLDGFDRSQLRREVEKVKPRRLGGLKKKYATWALGASLALGGVGVPIRIVHHAQSKAGQSGQRAPPTSHKRPEVSQASTVPPAAAKDPPTRH